MKTVDITPDAMARHIARFAKLKPIENDYAEREGVPPEALRMIAADRIYTIVSEGAAPGAAVGGGGISVYVLDCPPGDGPAIHAHVETHESFMCLRGRFRIRYGDHGRFETILDENDFIAVPPGVMRQFENVSETENATLLVIIAGQPEDALRDVYYPPEVGAKLEERFGADAKAGIERMGLQFTAEQGASAD
ncbi:MAG: cupin domain-containing protein [Alphaproteobacteria bacterium]|nr:cupin domain-containing protein [Alphaproteobacteria bacterium]